MTSKSKSRHVKELARKLNDLGHNMRAEAVVSDLVLNGFDRNDIEIENDSSHKINWDKDLNKAESKEGKLLLHLTRDGLFHSLPEYLFLKPVEGSDEPTEQILEFNRKQTRNTKILFSPIENEFFRNSVDIELFENELFATVDSGSHTQLRAFWKINDRLDSYDQIKLCRVIPYLHAIVGNFALTARCLEYFLEEKVSWKLISTTAGNNAPQTKSPLEGSLGFCSCGIDTITGGIPDELVPLLAFTIGPVPAEQIDHYREKGRKKEMIDSFIQYCIPMQYETEFILDIIPDEAGFILDNSHLGLNAICK